MQCKRDKNDASRYLSDLMDERERLDYEAHLDACAECREELARYRRMLVMLGELPAEKAPLGLSRALDEAADEHFGAEKTARPISTGRWATLRVAAAAVLVGAIITAAYFVFRPDEQPTRKNNDTVATEDHTPKSPAEDLIDGPVSVRDETADDFEALAIPEGSVDILATELDANPNERYPEARLNNILSIAEKTEVDEVLYLYNSRVGRSSNLEPAVESGGRAEDAASEAVPETALEAAEQSARLKRLYVGATRQVRTTEQEDKLRAATENSRQNVLEQNQQIIEQQAMSQTKRMQALDTAGAGKFKAAKPGAAEPEAEMDIEALKKREKELVDALAALDEKKTTEQALEEPENEDKKGFEIAKRQAIECELADVRAKIQHLQEQQQSQTEAMPPQSSDAADNSGVEGEPKDEKPLSEEYQELDNLDAAPGGSARSKDSPRKEAAPQVVVRPIFRQTLVVQVAVGQAGDEKVAAIVASLKPLLAERAAQLAEGQTVESELSDAQIAELLVKLSHVGNLKLSLGPLEAGFERKAPGEEADSERDDKPSTILSMCIARLANDAP